MLYRLCSKYLKSSLNRILPDGCLRITLFASNPDEVSKPASAAETAIKFMLGYKGDWSDITKVTKFVNGGTIGLEDRAKHFQAYLKDPAL